MHDSPRSADIARSQNLASVIHYHSMIYMFDLYFSSIIFCYSKVRITRIKCKISGNVCPMFLPGLFFITKNHGGQ